MITQKITDFQLSAYYPYVPELNRSAETGVEPGAIFDPIPAKVPGSVYRDLLEAGLIRDPYFGMQSLECEWVAARWWKYTASFRLPESVRGRNLRLRLCGVDDRAAVAFNRTRLGRREGMYVPYVFPVTELAIPGGDNTVSVVLEHAPDEMGQIGYTDRTFTQKARFTYKWDFCTRMVGMGLWGGVQLEDFGIAAIEYADIRTVRENGGFTVRCGAELTAFRAGRAEIRCALSYGDAEVCAEARTAELSEGSCGCGFSLPVPDPKLWDVLDRGEQNLYTLTLSVHDADGLSDRRSFRVGLRTLEYEQCDGAGADALRYIPVINGRRTYIKGVNMTPVDMMYGCVTREQLRQRLEQLRRHHINLVRVWGGGIIESEDFYDLCDELGIMVWQEFIQSSSGISNTPSKRPEFLALAAETAEEAVRVKRNHACLVFWSGGNELTDERTVPSTFEDENLRMLLAIVQRLDGERLMLPTSGSGPSLFLQADRPGMNHDVHGDWKYGGVREHYRVFNASDSMLHSEFGADGMTNFDKLARILPAEHLDRVYTMKENAAWRHHGEWWDTITRDEGIFYNIDRTDLAAYVKISQAVQAEAVRYALTANRRRAFQNAGSIVWQYNECYPNVSSTALSDYWGDPKLALRLAGEAFRPFAPALRYDKILFEQGDSAEAEIFVLSDEDAGACTVRCTVTDFDGSPVTDTETSVNVAAGATAAGEIRFTVGGSPCYYAEVRAQYGGETIRSLYLFLTAVRDGKADARCAVRFYDLCAQ